MRRKFIKEPNSALLASIFSYKNIFLIGFGFISLVIFSNFAIRYIREDIFKLEPLPYWPIGEFWPRIPSVMNLIAAAIVLLCFLLAIRYLPKIRYKLHYLMIFGIVLVLGSNLIQGLNMGFTIPITSGSENGIQYYHDAIKINDPYFFLSHFEQMQPGLLCHSRTHPPGAVLLIYFLLKILRYPLLISIAITIVAVYFSMLFLYRILLTEFEDAISKYITFLFILIPSIQIYYTTSIDALIASFLLGALYFFIYPRPLISIIGSVIFLFLSSFMTFNSLFLLPIMAGFEIIRKKSCLKTVSILLGIVFIYLIIYIFSRFNYLNSFRIAAILENPKGFRLFTYPVNYLFTRITDIYEIFLFLGPFLGILTIKGMIIMKRNISDISTMTWLAISTLLAMFLTGAFRTGETARICLFIYPYLLFPVATLFKNIRISSEVKNTLLFLVFFQGILMQIFGFYAW